MPRKKPSPDLNRWAQLSIAVAVFIGGMFTNALTITKNIASVDLVESRYKSSLAYTDSKTADAIKLLQDYSDRNRLQIEKQMETEMGLLREQGAVLGQVKDWLQRLADRVTQIADNTSRHK